MVAGKCEPLVYVVVGNQGLSLCVENAGCVLCQVKGGGYLSDYGLDKMIWVRGMGEPSLTGNDILYKGLQCR